MRFDSEPSQSLVHGPGLTVVAAAGILLNSLQYEYILFDFHHQSLPLWNSPMLEKNLGGDK